MTSSIAMTTYNAKSYIITLMDSLREQTRQPDEVIIVDDCSTDDTYTIVKEYICKYNLLNWQIIENEKNIGWKKNFREAIRRCSGDLIFLCDQDDIWKNNKIEHMHDVMCEHPEILLLVSNYSVVNVDRKDRVRVKGLNRNDGYIEKWIFNENALTVMRPGCTYCARNRLVDLMLSNDIETEPHDQILWGYAILNDGLYLLNEKTIVFRRHSDSASLVKNISKEERRRNTAYVEFFINVANDNDMKSKADILKDHMFFIKERARIVQNESISEFVLFQLKNRKHYATIRNMISDILYVIKK